MLGFAVLDNQSDDGSVAVWLTSRSAQDRADHVNAVSLASDDPRRETKLRALITDRIVVLTSGSHAPEFVANALPVDILKIVSDEIEHAQDRITTAVAEYSERNRSKNLVRPTFAPIPAAPDLSEIPFQTPTERALTTANYLARLWTCWLGTDAQRRRRSIDPKKGTAPWIMPDGLSDVELAELPPSLSDKTLPQPVSAC